MRYHHRRKWATSRYRRGYCLVDPDFCYFCGRCEGCDMSAVTRRGGVRAWRRRMPAEAPARRYARGACPAGRMPGPPRPGRPARSPARSADPTSANTSTSSAPSATNTGVSQPPRCDIVAVITASMSHRCGCSEGPARRGHNVCDERCARAQRGHPWATATPRERMAPRHHDDASSQWSWPRRWDSVVVLTITRGHRVVAGSSWRAPGARAADVAQRPPPHPDGMGPPGDGRRG